MLGICNYCGSTEVGAEDILCVDCAGSAPKHELLAIFERLEANSAEMDVENATAA
jgi:hypothetical protein